MESVRPSFSCLLKPRREGDGSSRQNFIESKKKPLLLCVCWIFAAMMADEQQLCRNTKRERCNCVMDSPYVVAPILDARLFRVCIFFFFYRGKVRRSLDEFPYLYMTQCCSSSCTTQGLPEYKKGGQKMSATMSISLSSSLSRERQWVFLRAFIYIRFRTMPKSLSGSSLFLYYYSSALSLSFILAI